MSRFIIYIAIAGLLFIPLFGYAERVASVYDGDSITLQDGRKVRLWGVDAPEIDQDFGRTSRDRLRTLILGRNVTLHCHGKTWKRDVCRVMADGLDVQRQLVEEGLAFPSVHSMGVYNDSGNRARMGRRGAWGQPIPPVMPWDHRRGK